MYEKNMTHLTKSGLYHLKMHLHGKAKEGGIGSSLG